MALIPYLILLLIVLMTFIFRDEILPKFREEDFFIIILTNIIFWFLILFMYGEYFEDLFGNRITILFNIEGNVPIIFNEVVNYLRMGVEYIAKFYIVFQKNELMFFCMIGFYLFCIYYIISDIKTPVLSRAIIVLGNYFLFTCINALMILRALNYYSFYKLTLLLGLYQLVISLTGFIYFLDLIGITDWLACNPNLENTQARDKLKIYSDKYTSYKASQFLVNFILVFFLITYVVNSFWFKMPLPEWAYFSMSIGFMLISIFKKEDNIIKDIASSERAG